MLLYIIMELTNHMERPGTEDDLKGGIQIIDLLHHRFDGNIEKILDRYCVYDALSQRTATKYEMQCRRYEFCRYSTIFIPVHQKRAYTAKQRLVFVFCFTDSLCYIKYNEELFDTFARKKVRRQCHSSRPVEHFCVPTSKLVHIEI